ncbi:MAG: NUDIX domain-containing protein [Bacteroidia bacterium]
MSVNRFNLRVYGICLEDKQLLITDEIRGGNPMTKLPGGGIELGEGIVDALKREFQEEMGVEIEVSDLFYITPFFQTSVFRPSDQVISIYYFVKLLEKPEVLFLETAPFDDPNLKDHQSFRWVALDKLTTTDMTYPADKCMLANLQGLAE